jgi:ribose transport system substrate-binding protein
MKKVLKVLSLLMAVCLMVSVFAACGSNSTKEAEKQAASTTEQKAEKKLKIGVIYLTAEHPYYQAHAKHTQAYAKEKGFDLVELDGKVDQANMATQMENLVAQKVDGIIYCLLDGKAASADINAAQAAGIPVITFAIKHDPASASCTFVGLDEKAAGALGGEKAGEYFKKNFADKKAKIAVVELAGVSASTDRSDGFIEGFKKVIPDAEVAIRLNGEGKKDKAMTVVEDTIQASPDINVWFGANGDQGLGALAALEAHGRGTVKTDLVVSHDGSEPELLKIADPNSALKIANANNPKELAQKTVDTILEMINGKRDMKNTDDLFVPTAVITGEDLDAAQKFLKEEFLSDTQLKK